MDAYEASNYLPELTLAERQIAETELALPRDMENPTQMEDFFFKTRILQRHGIEKPLEWHLKTFSWLRKVCFKNMFHSKVGPYPIILRTIVSSKYFL